MTLHTAKGCSLYCGNRKENLRSASMAPDLRNYPENPVSSQSQQKRGLASYFIFIFVVVRFKQLIELTNAHTEQTQTERKMKKIQIKRKVNALSRNYEIAHHEGELYSDSEKEKAEKMILKLEADLENNREEQGFDGSLEGVNEYLKANNCEIEDDQKWKIGDGSWC